MNKHLKLKFLALIAVYVCASTLHAQTINTADFQEFISFYDPTKAPAKTLSATGANVSTFTLNENPSVPSVLSYTTPAGTTVVRNADAFGGYDGSLSVNLSSSGLLTLTSTGKTNLLNALSINLSNINITPSVGFNAIITGIQSVSGTNPSFLTNGLNNPQTIFLTSNSALTSVSAGSLQQDTVFTDNSVSITFTDLANNFRTANVGGTATYQLLFSEVPEPREWAAIVLLGGMGLMVVRRLRNRLTLQKVTA